LLNILPVAEINLADDVADLVTFASGQYRVQTLRARGRDGAGAQGQRASAVAPNQHIDACPFFPTTASPNIVAAKGVVNVVEHELIISEGCGEVVVRCRRPSQSRWPPECATGNAAAGQELGPGGVDPVDGGAGVGAGRW
jgi:hypothetical protein